MKTEVEPESGAADGTTEHPDAPPAVAEGVAEGRKKVRFVRERTEKKPPAKPVTVPARQTTPAGKMMSRNVSYRPKDEPNTGPKSKSRTKP